MFCKFCGTQIEDGVKFCPSCGKATNESGEAFHVTESYKRLIHSILDSILMYAVMFGIMIGVFASFDISDESSIVYVAYLIFPLYYIFFEGIWQRTPAKFLTGTKVVNYDGTKPTFGTIVLRTLLRYVPFDALSFLFSDSGWHDRWIKTLVVPSNYTEENVKAIDHTTKKKKSTLLVVLVIAVVMIAVIGILAAVVLVSLNSARVKSRDARRISDMHQIQTGLELYYNDVGGYPGYDIMTFGAINCDGNDYVNPVPNDPSHGAEYVYLVSTTELEPRQDCGKDYGVYDDYQVEFTLEGDTLDYKAGVHRATPLGIE